MPGSYTSEKIKLLAVGTSAAGMFCLSLSELLPWPVFIILAFMHVVILRRYFDRDLIGPWTALAIITGVFAFDIFQLTHLGRSAVVSTVRDMILTLAIIRLLMKKTPREIYQIVGISFAQCLLATIFTISPLFLVGLILMVFLIPMTLYALDAASFSFTRTIKIGKPVHWVKVSIGIVLASCLLFYLLPRPASSIIKQGMSHRGRISFTEDVDLKESGRSTQGQTVVLRVVWSSGKPLKEFYLSGARLEGISPDGFFKQESRGSVAPVSGSFTDRLTIYTTSLYSENVLFPFWVYSVLPRLCLFRGTNLYWGGEPPAVYDVWVNRVSGLGNPGSTEIPRELSQVRELAVRIAGQGEAASRVHRIARYLMRTCAYTLDKQNIPPGRRGIEWFVLTNRKGSCEHFASALAAMIRSCGIPARVVTGFLVTEYNERGDYFIVRASDAHAWVEYFDKTWVIIDATPSGTQATAMKFHIIDELRFRWLRWVIQYSLEDQINLAAGIFTTAPRITARVESLTKYAVFLLVAGLCLWILYRIIRIRFVGPYEKVRRLMTRKGIVLPENSTHEEHLRVISESWPVLAPHFERYLAIYLAWRFGDNEINIQEHTRLMLRKIRNTPGPR
jgi:protein-glutamine gamma-glutamyltransferase